jgi:peptide-methionine (R)-S-oxide reductase
MLVGQRLLQMFKPLKSRNERDGKPLPHCELVQDKLVPPQHHNGSQPIPYATEHDTESMWRGQLTREEFRVLRSHGTERPRSHRYDTWYPDTGCFACRACGLPLYAARAKFDSGSGWPSFGTHVQGAVATTVERSPVMGKRVEIHCARCQSHLGHVFADTNTAKWDRLKTFSERHCVNGISLMYSKNTLSRDCNPHATVLS